MSRCASALFTDLYELRMLEAYLLEGMTEEAVFSLFVRRLPPSRNFLLACGLQTVLEFLQELRFGEDDLAYLRSLGDFSPRLLESLRELRFTGSVRAVPEGTPVFANEPILEIRAPIAQGQLVETFVMNQVQTQTLLASKAARVVSAANGRDVVDFAARRMHGTDAAVKGARAFYIAGVAATSNVLAGREYGLPLAGTMAHSYIQAHEHESDAFLAFARAFPGTTLLVDTYDTIEGVRRVISLARSRGEQFRIGALRLDSGDLAGLARESRRLLDAAGLEHVKIFASGGLDETSIAELVANAPIDAFGVGTSLGVSADAPGLDIAYKLTQYAGTGRVKLSADKPIIPGAKQVFRVEERSAAVGDVIGRADEDLPGQPLLAPVMEAGAILRNRSPSLQEIRARAREEVAKLPATVRAIQPASPPYPVRVSEKLARDESAVRETLARR